MALAVDNALELEEPDPAEELNTIVFGGAGVDTDTLVGTDKSLVIGICSYSGITI